MFNSNEFAIAMIAESVFHDEEYGLFSNIVLIDMVENRELYFAFYDPEEDQYMIEEATEWARSEDEENYFNAVQGESFQSFDTVEELADAVFELAKEHILEPRVVLVFEDIG